MKLSTATMSTSLSPTGEQRIGRVVFEDLARAVPRFEREQSAGVVVVSDLSPIRRGDRPGPTRRSRGTTMGGRWRQARTRCARARSLGLDDSASPLTRTSLVAVAVPLGDEEQVRIEFALHDARRVRRLLADDRVLGVERVHARRRITRRRAPRLPGGDHSPSPKTRPTLRCRGSRVAAR